jgi:hypothetical protein
LAARKEGGGKEESRSDEKKGRVGHSSFLVVMGVGACVKRGFGDPCLCLCVRLGGCLLGREVCARAAKTKRTKKNEGETQERKPKKNENKLVRPCVYVCIEDKLLGFFF